MTEEKERISEEEKKTLGKQKKVYIMIKPN